MPRRMIEDGVPEDTEGNMPRIKLPEPAVETETSETEDTEGNATKLRP
jgi:hypothetical protein